MVKRNKSIKPRNQSLNETKQKSNERFFALSNNEWYAAIFVILYALVEFIPAFAAWDSNGPQWVYLSSVNLLGFVYLLKRKFNGVDRLKTAPMLLYVLFLLSLSLSFLYSYNRIESLFSFAHYLTTFIIFFLLSIIIGKSEKVFNTVAKVLSLILLIQSVQIINAYLTDFEHFDAFISAGLNTGNKNMLAACMVIKLPFALYCFYKGDLIGRWFFGFIIILAVGGLVIDSARSTFLSMMFMVCIYFIYIVFKIYNQQVEKKGWLDLVWVIVFFIVGIYASNWIVSREYKSKSGQGYFEERLSTIQFNNEASSLRLQHWKDALNYIGNQKGIKGCGAGNWKLASIPYERNINPGYKLNLNVHNDFLQLAAEGGIYTSLLFILLLITIVFRLTTIIVKRKFETDIPVFLLMAISCYLIDASFNFPTERAVMQVYFGIILAFSHGFFNSKEKGMRDPSLIFNSINQSIPWVIGMVCIYTIAFNILNYQSLTAQRKFSDDSFAVNPQRNWDEVKSAFHDIPNMDIYTIPIPAIKARYLIKDLRYVEALELLHEADEINPVLGYTDFLKATIYAALNQPDSAYYFTNQSFVKRPGVQNTYFMLTQLASQRKDLTAIESAFKEEEKINSKDWVWDYYLVALAKCGVNDQELSRLTDSAMAKFPDSKLFVKKKVELKELETSKSLLSQATQSFDRKNYSEAIRIYKEAINIDSTDFSGFENIGLSYFYLKQYQKSMDWLKKSIVKRKIADGKSEFVIGLCLFNLGLRDQSCSYLKQAVELNFPGAKEKESELCK